MIYEITLVFDDFDVRERRGEEPLTMEGVTLYAENLGRDLYSFKHLPGYSGFRVEARQGISTEEFAGLTLPGEERGTDGYDTDQALADLRRISRTLAGFEGDDEAQGMAADLNQASDWFASGQFE